MWRIFIQLYFRFIIFQIHSYKLNKTLNTTINKFQRSDFKIPNHEVIHYWPIRGIDVGTEETSVAMYEKRQIVLSNA